MKIALIARQAVVAQVPTPVQQQPLVGTGKFRKAPPKKSK